MTKALSILVVLAAVAGIGWLLLDNLAIKPVSTDLTSVGQGTPVLVLAFENYSPAGLNALERLKAVRGNYEGRLLFRVADLGAPAGQTFAERYGLENAMVALLGGDGDPVLRSYLPGTNEGLKELLDAHLPDTFKQSSDNAIDSGNGGYGNQPSNSY